MVEIIRVVLGVRQGCVMSGFLFIIAIDWIMRNTTKDLKRGIIWKFTSSLEDYADDLALLASIYQNIRGSNELNQAAEYIGLNIRVNKTKVIRINNRNNNAVRIDEHTLEDDGDGVVTHLEEMEITTQT